MQRKAGPDESVKYSNTLLLLLNWFYIELKARIWIAYCLYAYYILNFLIFKYTYIYTFIFVHLLFVYIYVLEFIYEFTKFFEALFQFLFVSSITVYNFTNKKNCYLVKLFFELINFYMTQSMNSLNIENALQS